MPTAAILSIGDELALGQTVDTNSAWISNELVGRSILPREHRTVPDDRAAIAAAIAQLAERSDVLLITGGLGPTEDDLTREALGDVLTPGKPLVRDDSALEQITRHFAKRGRKMPAMNARQAMRPETAGMLVNPFGTAPGLSARLGNCLVFSMPGPPVEMHKMFFDHVVPAIGHIVGDQVVVIGTVQECGLGESAAAELLGGMMDRDANPLVGTTASQNIVTARIRATGTIDEARKAVNRTIERIQELWRPYAFGSNESTLAQSAGDLLKLRGFTLATAESCTGGWLGKMIVDVAGSSDYYVGGFVTYSDEMKRRQLQVDSDLLKTHGAVSAEVAAAMARGAIEGTSATCSLSITGIAGPGGERPDKPVGTVFIGIGTRDPKSEVMVRRFMFPGDRSTIRDRAAKSALQMLRFLLLDVPPEKSGLLWQAGDLISFPFVPGDPCTM
ncbi:MAG TPA: CinA family nicotinamide mononucleotide deamidase-related protein [Phycisphaerales bacterium]|nr:CinA family nicotinamide mononucleotide deamidase-related protein [Phycisphaerales bacterium]